MQTLIDIPEDHLKLLDRISQELRLSRAEFVRRAITAYLDLYKEAERGEGFGLWADHPVDGLAYQEKMRSEWQAPRPSSTRTS